jgi:hypothetical protein
MNELIMWMCAIGFIGSAGKADARTDEYGNINDDYNEYDDDGDYNE